MKSYAFVILALVSVMFSCSDDETTVADQARSESTGHFVSLAEALENAYSFLDSVAEDSMAQTRTADRSVSSVELIDAGNSSTRGLSDFSSTLYLVNFGNQEGFALLSSDNRLKPVYAISDEGELRKEDFEEDTPLRAFLGAVQLDVQNTQSSPYINYSGNRSCIVNAQCKPILKLGVRKWHQKYPYNKYCPMIGNNSTMVGCVAVAVGQVMSVYAHPSELDGRTFVWRIIKNGSYAGLDNVAYLLAYLGKPENLNMQYAKDVSLASKYHISRTFTNMGYEEPSSWKKFSEKEITDILDQAIPSYYSKYGPIIIYGKRNGAGFAHAHG